MEELDEADFISCNTGYQMGGYWDLFDECFLPCEEKGDIRYFVYNPIKYGAAPDKKYPVLMWIHGLNCAIDGRRCVAPREEELASLEHCMINQIQANLIYSDGTCYDERLPKGVTGWIWEVCFV